jgi:RNA polymerase primary sigma factor
MARTYLRNFSRRREILAATKGKLERLAELSQAIKESSGTIIFTQTKEAASDSINHLTGKGIRGAVLSSDLDPDSRREVLAAYEDGDHEVVAAPLMLDEGVNVPLTDLAIIVASSRSKRQLIQRMGRVLRTNDDDKKIAKILVLYVEGTSEDPANAFRTDFMDLIQDVAGSENFKIFAPEINPGEILKFLYPGILPTEKKQPAMLKAIAHTTYPEKSSFIPRFGDMENTPLLVAIKNNDCEKFRGILSAGDVQKDIANKAGITPVMAAAQIGNWEMAELLIDKHADYNIRDNKGRSAL